MKQSFYVKNDLNQREDVRGIIQHPIWPHFGIRRPSITIGNEVQACLIAFNTVCTYIGTGDLVQEHIAFKVWPLANEWEMPKETAAGSSQGGLVYLKYTFEYSSQFDEPNDDWLDAIEVTSDELLGAYSKIEDEAMTVAFGARGKRRLNRVFDVIGFVYHDCCFPARRQGGKRKVATSTSSSASKPKRAKVLTRRPKPIGRTEVPKLIESTEATPSAMETAPAMSVEASANLVKEPESEKIAEQPKVLSPLVVTGLSKLSTTTTTTPRKRRMASVLYVVLESMKAPTLASAKASSEKSEDAREVITSSATTALAKARPSKAAPVRLMEESLPKKTTSPALEAPPHGDLEYIVRHTSGKQLSLDQIAEVQHCAKDLKYPRGSLVYRGNGEDDFLYCLPDSKEVNVCREMMNNMGFPKLELGLSAMTKDQLADNLTYNSLKVCIFWLCIWYFSL
jgi:hypothetical protein